jgi:hypothetical protein
MHGHTTKMAEGRKQLIELEQKMLAEDEETAKQEAAKAEDAKARAARLSNYRGAARSAPSICSRAASRTCSTWLLLLLLTRPISVGSDWSGYTSSAQPACSCPSMP